MRLLHATLSDGRRVAYSSETKFLIQVAKGLKGSYETTSVITGNIVQAMFHYTNLKLEKGYKKRLLVPSFNKPVLFREMRK